MKVSVGHMQGSIKARERERQEEAKKYEKLQPLAMPEVVNLLDKNIKVPFPFHIKTGDCDYMTQSCWYKGKVIEILPKT